MFGGEITCPVLTPTSKWLPKQRTSLSDYSCFCAPDLLVHNLSYKCPDTLSLLNLCNWSHKILKPCLLSCHPYTSTLSCGLSSDPCWKLNSVKLWVKHCMVVWRFNKSWCPQYPGLQAWVGLRLWDTGVGEGWQPSSGNKQRGGFSGCDSSNRIHLQKRCVSCWSCVGSGNAARSWAALGADLNKGGEPLATRQHERPGWPRGKVCVL